MLSPANLRQYQWKAIEFLKSSPIVALFLDMGLGKTIALLTFIKLMLVQRDSGIKVWLGVAPLRVVKAVWRQEALKWTHTQDVVFSVVHGSERKRRAALDVPAHVYLINPEGLMWLVEMLHRLKLDQPGRWPFDGLFIDESSMFKASSTKRWKALAKVLHLFKQRVIMTGTPTPNSMLELWPQIYILDMGERLGSTFGRFRERFFIREEVVAVTRTPVGDQLQYRWGLRNGADRRLNALVRDICLRLDAADWLTLPPLIGLDAHAGGPCDVFVDLPDDVMDMYNRLEDEMFLELETSDVEAVNAAALSGKCHQIANGAIYADHRESGERVWEPVHDCKLDALDEIVNECGGPLLVAYQYRHDLARLRAAYPSFAVVADMDIEAFEREWNAGQWPGALMHPKSAGHGLNLQDGGRNAAFFSMTWSKEQIDQFIARIGPTRQAQAGRALQPIKCYRIIARNTVDEAIVESNGLKSQGQRAMLNALNAYRKHKQAQAQFKGR